jgi:hypothetical protein
MNREARNPQKINPELKIGATFDTPRSLSALSVQLNLGERAIEMPIDARAQIGAMIPNHAAIFGSIISLRFDTTKDALLDALIC